MKIIFNSGVVTCIVGENVYTKTDVSKDFIAALEACTTDQEVRELMVDTSEIPKEQQVPISEWDKFVDQNYSRVVDEFKQDPKKYFIYKNSNGVVKLARDILVRSKSFKEQNNEVIGNIQTLFDEKMQKAISNRVIII